MIPSRAAARSSNPRAPHFACFLLEARKHAKCCRVGDVERPRCSHAFPILAAIAARPVSRCRRPLPSSLRYAVTQPGYVTEVAEPTSAPTPTLIARADVAGNDDAGPTRYKTPRCHGGCGREEQPPRQRPYAESLRYGGSTLFNSTPLALRLRSSLAPSPLPQLRRTRVEVPPVVTV